MSYYLFPLSLIMKLDYPATGRNREYILNVIKNYLPKSGTVLEVASGSGQHICYLAQHFPELIWQPSDIDPNGMASVNAWKDELELKNVKPCLELDAESSIDAGPVDFMMCINMIHISPWSATLGLFKQAQKFLKPDSYLYLYGPFKEEDVETAPSNVNFDFSLKSRNPEWGIRSLSEVKKVAEEHSLKFVFRQTMPANNLSVLFQKT